MTSAHNPLRINVGFLFNQPRGSFRDFPFNLDAVEVDPDLTTGRFTGNLRISRTSEGLLLQSEFHTNVPATCVRCLEDFDQPLTTEFTELYVFPKQIAYDPVTKEGPELIVPEDGFIDLAPIIREYLVLEIPIKPLHHPDCKGLCPQCGANWNQTTCVHLSDSNTLFQESDG